MSTDDMKTYHSRVRYALENKGISQKEMARQIGTSQQNVSNLITKAKGSKKNAAIATALGVNPTWLETGNGDMYAAGEAKTVFADTKTPQHKTDLVPLISSVTAGNWAEAIDNFSPGDAEDWIPCYIQHSEKTFALRVDGPSMEPEFRHNEIIVVDPERASLNGSYVVAKKKEDNTVTFKQLVVTEGKSYLKAMNPDWPNRFIEVDGDWSICGVVIYSHRVHI